MVSVDGDGFVVNFNNVNNLGVVWSLGLELYVWFDGVDVFECRVWYWLNEFFVYFFVFFSWFNRYFYLIVSVFFV